MIQSQIQYLLNFRCSSTQQTMKTLVEKHFGCYNPCRDLQTLMPQYFKPYKHSAVENYNRDGFSTSELRPFCSDIHWGSIS